MNDFVDNAREVTSLLSQSGAVCSVQEILRRHGRDRGDKRDIGIVLTIDNSNKQSTRKLTTVRTQVISLCVTLRLREIQHQWTEQR